MNVSLTPELEQYIAGKVGTGMYQTASEVVRDALRALKEREERQSKLEELRREIDRGLDPAARGQVRDFTEETAARVKARGRRRRQGGAQAKP
jgi:antitoxin ParD1/3/4